MDSPNIAGTLRFGTFSPRALLERFGRNVPATADPAALGNAELSAGIAVGEGRAVFESLNMRLDDTTLTGPPGVGRAC